MHIQEGTNTTLTTCTKMTEEVDRRHGVNGNSSSKSGSEDASVHNSAHTGGRLKFFKDGKFILELVRGCAREGERVGWVSVPRKTFWPPAGAPPTPPALPPPPPASLSVSDDNSSVHSSPWQRDHCWKQPAPRRDLSRDLAMYYCRPSTLHSADIAAASRAKRRRPLDTAHPPPPPPPPPPLHPPQANGVCERRRNGDAASSSPDADGDDDRDRDRYYRMKLKKPHHYHKLRVYKKTRPARSRRDELTRTIDKLRERVAALPAPVNAKLASCRQEHMMVSPRKRILRELERVSLEEQGGKRRARPAAPPPAGPPPAPAPGPSHAPRREPPVSRNVSSYSIHSLLSMPEEAGEHKRSPAPSPSPEYRYRPPGPAAPPDSPTPPSAADLQAQQRYRAGYAPYATCPRQWADAYGYSYGYGYGYRAPAAAPAPGPPLWLHYLPPAPWPPLAHSLAPERPPAEDHTSDLPLNLSKH